MRGLAEVGEWGRSRASGRMVAQNDEQMTRKRETKHVRIGKESRF